MPARPVLSRNEVYSQWFLGNPDCTPGYYNNEGKPIGRRERLNGSGYPEGPAAYFHYIEAWRNSGDFAGLEFGSGPRTLTRPDH